MWVRSKVIKRWITNNFMIVVIVLVLLSVVLSLAVRAYYYRAAENSVSNRLDSFETYFTQKYLKNLSTSDGAADVVTAYNYLEKLATEMVELFDEKDRFELQIVAHNGDIIISSSGFFFEENYKNEVEKASVDKFDRVFETSKTSSGEKTIAGLLVLRNVNNSVIGGVRFSTSLMMVDRQILITVIMISVVSIFILVFTLISSSYFIGTMVQPLNEINLTARKIATGDYNARIERNVDDEVGELCETINFMAEEVLAAEKIKNDFISSVSHELRTPLTAIKGWSETLQQVGTSDEEMTSKGLDIITGEVQRLSGIVEELLDFSQVSSGHISIKFERIDVSAELTEAVYLYEERAKREGVELIYIEPEMLSVVLGDRDRLKQVFINIIDNAVKYTPSGGKVRVETAEMGNAIQIVVSDTGEGIPKEALSQIKKRFYRVNRTRPGSGIGLALADEIVRRHKGRLDIDSELGKGTTASIMLPIAPKEE